MDTVEAFFSKSAGQLDKDRVAGMSAVFQFVATGDGGGAWHIDIADGEIAVRQGTAENPSVTLTATVADWRDIVGGQLGARDAFLTGQLKLQGDVTLAMKLSDLLPIG